MGWICSGFSKTGNTDILNISIGDWINIYISSLTLAGILSAFEMNKKSNELALKGLSEDAKFRRLATFPMLSVGFRTPVLKSTTEAHIKFISVNGIPAYDMKYAIYSECENIEVEHLLNLDTYFLK